MTEPPVWQRVLGHVEPVEPEPVKREPVRPSAWALLTVLPVVLLGLGELVALVNRQTADTLTAARRMRGMGCKVFAVTNVLGSSAARESDGTLYVQAGPEVCVCSTKAYTAQMVACALFALRLAQARGRMDADEVARHCADLETLPDLISTVISRSWQDKQAAGVFRRSHSALFLGRGVNSTTA